MNFVAFGVIPESGTARVESEHFSSGQKSKGKAQGDMNTLSFRSIELICPFCRIIATSFIYLRNSG